MRLIMLYLDTYYKVCWSNMLWDISTGLPNFHFDLEWPWVKFTVKKIAGRGLKGRISKMHFFQETQKTDFSLSLSLIKSFFCYTWSSATVTFSFSKSEMGFYGYAVLCVHRHGTSCFKSHHRRLGKVQLIPYPRGLQQNKRLECE